MGKELSDVSLDLIAESLTDEQVNQLSSDVKAKLDTGEQRISELHDVYSKHGVTIVLGAGVSVPSKVPAWNELIVKLQVQGLAKKLGASDSNSISHLQAIYETTEAGDARILARYVKEMLGEDEFLNAVRGALYASVVHESKLFEALARFCQKNEGIIGVRDVLTYNFDTLFERALKKSGRKYSRVDKGKHTFPSGLPIRHVHGFLNEEKLKDGDKEWLVFSEEDYHEQFKDPYHWSNIVQLNAFRQNCCVFVGLSMQDPNIRRLLESVKNSDGVVHYAFMRKRESEAVQDQLESRIKWASQGKPTSAKKASLKTRVELICDIADEAFARSLEALKVKVIWFSKFEDLPALIDSVREGQGSLNSD